ncbi:MAG: N-acetylmuramoyl-L-alanine amidase [Pirellulales bacterium]|nr:N-acetylmuramoyl-L-alanine amidase [Pirellulales bacterium]
MARFGRSAVDSLRASLALRGDRKCGLPRPKVRRFELLEPRILLAGDIPGLEIASPAGQLAGKIVYTSAGHGWQWNTTLNRWATDRGDNFEIVEDFGNQDQMSFFADFLLRAGATVVPMRPVGHQLNEVVLDNDSPGVTFAGAWSNSSSTIFYDEDYGAVADAVPYRFASIAATETATATYRPNIPEAGYYPVYTWVRDGTDRTNQLYRIHDSAGGVTEIRVDHRKVGKGWVYLGTYHFDAGTSGSVVISNQSTAGGSVIIADAIRFGNGMGDMPAGPNSQISGYPREDENSLMWLWRSIGQGNNPSTVLGTSNVSAPRRMAEHMNANANPFGTSVYISFHSNASGGRGAVGLYANSASQRTPNQEALALYTGRQINQDMQALNGMFEHDWSNRTTHTYNGINFGEINAGLSAEMDMTIIETAFHDQQQDAELMRDPKVREQLARSTYEAVLEYFQNFGNLGTPVSQPSQPVDVRAIGAVDGGIQVSWTPGPTGVLGGTPTAYRVYVSRDGHGYLGYVEVPAGAGNTYAFAAEHLDEAPYYFKVVGVNAGGESPRSAVTSAQVQVGAKRLLIVDGFDRYDRTTNERYPYAFTGDGLTDRVRVRYNNTFDYVTQIADAIASTGARTNIDAVQNEAIIAGAVSLANYDAVVWFLGEESSADATFNAAEQAAVSAYLAGGGKLFVSGSEIGWDLDQLNNGRTFYNNVLRADFVADDANSYSVTGATGSIFAGLAAQFDNGNLFYNVDFPDVIAPLGGATAAFTYSTGGTAGIQYTGGLGEQVVMFGFPFETIVDRDQRVAIMTAIVDYFGFNLEFSGSETIVDNDQGSPAYVETGSWSTAAGTGYNGSTYRFVAAGSAATATWSFQAPVEALGEVFVQYRTGGNRAVNTTYDVDTGAGIVVASTNQTVNDAVWVSLGSFVFQPGVRSITLNAATSTGGSVVIADAVRIVLAPLPDENGDFNGDNFVDGSDFLAWQRGFGASSGASLADGDANGDGAVDAADLAVWHNQFGGPPGGGMLVSATAEVAAVPVAAATVVAVSADDVPGDPAAIAYRVDQLLQPATTPGISLGRIASTSGRLAQGSLARPSGRVPAETVAESLRLRAILASEQNAPRLREQSSGAVAEGLSEMLDAAFAGLNASGLRRR